MAPYLWWVFGWMVGLLYKSEIDEKTHWGRRHGVCFVWDMLYMRCVGNTLYLILSRWSCPGGCGIWEFGAKGFSRNNSKGHFIGFNYTWKFISKKGKKCFYRWNSDINLYFKELLFFQLLKLLVDLWIVMSVSTFNY